jgi:hypothetical protein
MEPIKKTYHSRASGNPVLLIISSGYSTGDFRISRNLYYHLAYWKIKYKKAKKRGQPELPLNLN